MPSPTAVVILGSTGSIGRQALEVITAHPERFRVLGLSAQRNLDLLLSQCERFQPQFAAVGEAALAPALRSRLRQETKLLGGVEGLCELASLPEADLVLSGISGLAGLKPLLAAIRAAKRIAIANKEPLVAAGEIVMAEAARHGATLLPVDSEHSAVFQLLQGRRREEIRRLILTGSGGPFLHSPADLSSVTAQQALSHPTWRMGAKVTIDSATLMNKGLEIIEASWLFSTPLSEIEVVIHPQSLVHSMVECKDGTLLAHLAAPDMRIPIQYALSFPERLSSAWSAVDLVKAGQLTFLPPDTARFPCLRLAREAALTGGAAPAVMNAANEIAVGQFLAGKIKFTDIPRRVEEALEAHTPIAHPRLEDILEADRKTRVQGRESRV